MVLTSPSCIYPERNRAPFAQNLIVLSPVSYLLFRLTHVVTALTIIKYQIAGLEKGSTDLGNNAHKQFKLAPVQTPFPPLNLIVSASSVMFWL
ncbi:hypothetical protein BCT41_24305 [Vibrio splendidus]|nr:hypothetical protein BCT41_24305 [Vibrio splendidus]